MTKFNPRDLTISGEDYLKAIYQLSEAGSPATTTGIAEALALTAPSVSGMVKRLADAGLLEHLPYKGVTLTEAGRQEALRMLRRHRLIEAYLVSFLGYGWDTVHDEAERLEHAVSDDLVNRMAEALGHPTVDPHGDPIPTAALKVRTLDYSALADLRDADIGVRCRVARIADQSPEFLRLVEKVGLRPGKKVRVTARDEAADTLEIELDRGRRASLGLRAAGKIFVERV